MKLIGSTMDVDNRIIHRKKHTVRLVGSLIILIITGRLF